MHLRVKLRPELSNCSTIDFDSPISDKSISTSPASDSGVGNNLIEAHFGHGGYPFSTVNSPT
jgi:hypothetical protein